MSSVQSIRHVFVEFIPEELDQGVLYISMEYGAVVHLCCCGCGERVITPLEPNEWHLLYDGESVSLTPSIGNWNFACGSHYWIRSSKIVQAPTWSDMAVNESVGEDKPNTPEEPTSANGLKTALRWLKQLFRRLLSSITRPK